jgi:2-keto-4-pentenoate hydratase/2-oxohepta-3-ene-1,7-dioic acid hydratase in catechol pathway
VIKTIQFNSAIITVKNEILLPEQVEKPDPEPEQGAGR